MYYFLVKRFKSILDQNKMKEIYPFGENGSISNGKIYSFEIRWNTYKGKCVCTKCSLTQTFNQIFVIDGNLNRHK